MSFISAFKFVIIAIVYITHILHLIMLCSIYIKPLNPKTNKFKF